MSPADAPRGDTPPLARSTDEADLYLSLQPCQVCGEIGLRPFGFSGGTLAGSKTNWIRTRCPHCAAEREFVFRVPEQPVRSLADRHSFGGPEPSELLDPGEWLLLADAMLADIPELPADLAPQRRAELYEQLDVARAATEEVLKFLPDGAAEVDPYAFWSQPGYEVHMTARWRFTRDWLEFQLTDIGEQLAALGPGPRTGTG